MVKETLIWNVILLRSLSYDKLNYLAALLNNKGLTTRLWFSRVALSQEKNVSAKVNVKDLISAQGIHSTLIIHNFLNMPHAPVCPFVDQWLLTLLGGCIEENIPFLHSPYFWKSVYMHLCIYLCLHEFPDKFSSSVPLEICILESFSVSMNKIFEMYLWRNSFFSLPYSWLYFLLLLMQQS